MIVMTKVMKITPREVREITDYRNDEDFVQFVIVTPWRRRWSGSAGSTA